VRPPQHQGQCFNVADAGFELIAALCPKSCGACDYKFDLNQVAAKWSSATCAIRNPAEPSIGLPEPSIGLPQAELKKEDKKDKKEKEKKEKKEKKDKSKQKDRKRSKRAPKESKKDKKEGKGIN